jgi:hypothetical protein
MDLGSGERMFFRGGGHQRMIRVWTAFKSSSPF